LTLPALPICWIETYTALSYVSITGISAAVIGMLCIFEYCTDLLISGHSEPGELNYFNFAGVFGHIGVAMFVFEGNACIVNVRDESKDKKAFPKVLVASLYSTLSVFMVFGLMAYVTFLDKSSPIIVSNFLPINTYTTLIRVFVCYNALCSYPVQILVAFEIIETAKWFSTGTPNA
jgi:amino acid permease